ncbi:MAG: YdcF family protein [Giesbergeria sp.]|nr:YdcF family protein [Giesbergeria sp.]
MLGGEDRTQWHRSRAAVRYYLACRAAGLALPRMLVTGGALVRQPGTGQGVGRGMAAGLTEAAWMARFMQVQGVPPEQVLQEAQALDTLGNVALGGALAARHGLQRLVVVSDDFHLRRSAQLFERVWGHPPAGCVGTGNTGSWRLRWREKLAFALQVGALRQADVAPGDSAAHLAFLAVRLGQQQTRDV